MSATIGTFAARTISLSAAVLSAVGHDTRIMSAPASSQRRIWSIVAFASSVGVLVMVWTDTGASPPTGTEPTMICRDLRRAISRHGRIEDMGGDIGARRAAAKAAQMGSLNYPFVLTGLTGSRGRRCRSLPNCRRTTVLPNRGVDVREPPEGSGAPAGR